MLSVGHSARPGPNRPNFHMPMHTGTATARACKPALIQLAGTLTGVEFFQPTWHLSRVAVPKLAGHPGSVGGHTSIDMLPFELDIQGTRKRHVQTASAGGLELERPSPPDCAARDIEAAELESDTVQPRRSKPDGRSTRIPESIVGRPAMRHLLLRVSGTRRKSDFASPCDSVRVASHFIEPQDTISTDKLEHPERLTEFRVGFSSTSAPACVVHAVHLSEPVTLSCGRPTEAERQSAASNALETPLV
ncbi:hypothetical protein C8T65DRAFT_744978 [Cerioporus squamosus]|nr:hypothetical protein C8T65DRAFT_744978 [Cerioporus squamosus]